MPYATNTDLPLAVRNKLKGKKLRQWRHVFNSAFERHQSESLAFAEAWATVKKAAGFGKGNNVMNEFSFFLPIAKVDKQEDGTCIVSGYASTPTKDSDDEIITLEAIKKALPSYMQWRNIREMHQLKAVGKAQEANVDTKGLFLQAKIVDPTAVKKCEEQVYNGFSIGGRKIAKVGDKITELELTEISIVDRPANPDCRISIAKSAKELDGSEGYLLKLEKKSKEAKALVKMAKVIETLAKEGPPAAHDGFSLPAPKKPDGVVSPNDSRPNENVTRKTEVEPKDEVVDKREFSDDKRQELASSGKALPDGSFPIENVQDLKNAIRAIGRAKNPKKAKAHIKARAKALNAESELPADWTKSKAAKKLAKAQLLAALGLGNDDSFLFLKKDKDLGFVGGEAASSASELKKGMGTAGSMAYCFDSLRDVQRSLLMEAKREGGDMKDKALAKQVGAIAKQLADVIGQKASHEGGEAATLTDANDSYLSSILGEDFNMDKANNVALSGDPLTDAIASLMKRAATPTKAARMAMAKEEVKKARKAMKECREAIEDAHKMHKAAYLSKAAKKDGKEKPDADGDFDHAGAMEKLNKAYSAAEKARTFGKAAVGNLEKAESIPGRSGQRGQEAGDGEAGFYEVPVGVKDLTPAAMSGAAPGTSGGAGQPPMYPGDGSVYPGKAEHGGDLAKYAKNGVISADVAELLLSQAKANGELEALRRLPAAGAGSGRRPYAFDMNKVTGGFGGAANGNGGDINKALFDGVDPNALNSNDEATHNAASARLIGNFLTSGPFAKSVFDPSFKGAAGSK